MTSKDTTDGEVSPQAGIAHREREALHHAIKTGFLPTPDQLRAGAPFFGDDIKRDVLVWCDSWVLSTELQKWQQVLTQVEPGAVLLPVIQLLRDTLTDDAMLAAERVLRLLDHDDADRLLVYLACRGHDDARGKLVASTRRDSSFRSDEYDHLFNAATAIGMIYARRPTMPKYFEVGCKIVASDAAALAKFEAAASVPAIEKSVLEAVIAASAMAEIESDVLDDCAEIVCTPTMVVVPTLPEGGSSHRRDIEKSWKGIAGAQLPIVARGDVAAHRGALVSAWPHAADIIDVILTDLAVRDEARFKPTCLLGPAGSGKSSLARAICEAVGLPCELYSMAGIADGSMGGTSAQWSTARESVPLQLIRRSRTANVGVIWDEVEKAGESKHNGSALDTLLPMLEIDQARRYRDLALEVEVDLSMVSHFATANSLEGIPAPLKDRMRILVMPEPGWQHLGTLTRQIVGRIARERGVDERWFAPLAEDELDLVRAAWPGGSIRQLTRILTTVIDGREQIMGRC